MIDQQNMIKIGIVSSVESGGKKARVYFPDAKNMVSGWLYILQRADSMSGVSVSIEYAGRHRHSTEEEYAGNHTHELSTSGGSISAWVPKVGNKVLCLFPYGDDTDGYILGGIP